MEKETKHSTAVILTEIFMIVFLFAFFMVLLYYKDNKYAAEGPQPIYGVLDLEKNSLPEKGFLFLIHRWQYFPDKLLTPKDFEAGLPDADMELVSIGQYNDFARRNPNKSPYGIATYRLLLMLPEKTAEYAITLPEIFSAYDFYVNGEKVISLGDIYGQKEETGIAAVSFQAAGKTELLLAVANRGHYYSGLTYPPVFGSSREVFHYEETVLFLHTLLFTLILLMIAVVLAIAFLAHLKGAGYYAFLCLCFAASCSYPVFFRLVRVAGSLWYGLELLGIYGSFALVAALQGFLCRTAKKYSRLITMFLTAIAVFAFFYGIYPVPAWIHRLFPIVSMLAKIVTAVYLMLNTVYVLRRDQGESYLLIGTTAVYAMALFADRLFPAYEPIYGGYFQEYGSFVMLIGLGIQLFREFLYAYRFQVVWSQDRKVLQSQLLIQRNQYKNLSEAMEEMRRQRHDHRHHLLVLEEYLKEGAVEKGLAYLGQCTKENQGPRLTRICDQPILDAMLRYYSGECRRYGIVCSMEMDITESIRVEDTDLAILAGNLLENAYQACMEELQGKMEEEGKESGKEICLRVMGKDHNGGLLFKVENSYSNKIIRKNGNFLTTKQGGSGIGIRSVGKIVSSYGGIMDVETLDGIFRVSVMI